MPHIPGDATILYGLELDNCCIVTSGDYRQYYIDSTGKRRHHIIDPKTGYPSEPVISATVISPSIIQADILSTALMVMGADKGTALIETLDNVESCIIYPKEEGGYEIKNSSGFNEYLYIEPE
jgi:thiamine biosynthesis lipoprotein